MQRVCPPPGDERHKEVSWPCPRVSLPLILTVLLIPPGRVQGDPTVVEQELVLRAGDPAFQERHEVPAVNHSGERRRDRRER